MCCKFGKPGKLCFNVIPPDISMPLLTQWSLLGVVCVFYHDGGELQEGEATVELGLLVFNEPDVGWRESGEGSEGRQDRLQSGVRTQIPQDQGCTRDTQNNTGDILLFVHKLPVRGNAMNIKDHVCCHIKIRLIFFLQLTYKITTKSANKNK